MVKIDSGELPSAVGKEGHDLTLVVHEWQKIADGRFPDDCSKLLQMIEETDRLELWKKRIGGSAFESRNEFLQKKVLINFDLTSANISKIVNLLDRGEVAAAQELFERAEAIKDRGKPGRKPKVIDGDSISYERGTTNENILRRLARDHNDIFAKVKSGELTVNQAAIQAGIRKKPTAAEIVVKTFAKVENRLETIRSIVRTLSDAERQVVKDWLSEQ